MEQLVAHIPPVTSPLCLNNPLDHRLIIPIAPGGQRELLWCYWIVFNRLPAVTNSLSLSSLFPVKQGSTLSSICREIGDTVPSLSQHTAQPAAAMPTTALRWVTICHWHPQEDKPSSHCCISSPLKLLRVQMYSDGKVFQGRTYI